MQDVQELRQMNDELRQRTVESLKQFNRAEVFAEAIQTHMEILAKVELMDAELDELEKTG